MSCIIWDETASIEQDRLEVQELPPGPSDRLPATSAGRDEDPYPRALARALSSVVGALAVLVLAAWIVDRPWLAAFPINASTMAVNTALAFLVAAAALVVLLRTDRSPVAQLGAFLVAAVGVATFVEHAWGRSLGIDQLVLAQTVAKDLPHPGQMPPLTAVCLVACGLGLLAVARGWRLVVQGCACVLFAVGFTVSVGYAYDARSLSRVGAYSTMALTSAMAFVLLSGALLLTAPDYGLVAFVRRSDAGGALLRRVLPLAVVGPVIVGWMQYALTRVAHLDSHVGLAIVVTGCHLILSAVIWRAATAASRLDKRWQTASDDLAVANASLEEHVASRSALLAATSGELQLLFNTAPIGLLKLDVEGRCVSVNPRWSEMSGLSDVESAGDGWWAAFHPDDVDSVASACSRLISEDSDVTFSYRLLDVAGRIRWIQGSASVLRSDAGTITGYLGVAADMTAYIEAQRELSDVQARMGAAFTSSPIGMALVSLEGTFTEVNGALCELVGRAPEELIGQPEKLIWHPDDEGGDVDALVEVLRGRDSSYEHDHRIARPDTAVCWVTETVAAVVVNGAPAYLVAEYVDITARRVAEHRLAHQALHDPLTGLPNRLLFTDRLEHALARARRNGSAVAVLFIDLDHFKVVNDSLGHDAGDRLLRSVGERLSAATRSTDTVARLGGDEFVVLAEDVSGDAKAAELAVRLSSALEEPTRLGDQLVTPKASIGISLTVGGADSAAVMLRNADTAMYRAKERGRARYELFDEELRIQAINRLAVIDGLRRAIDGTGPDAILGLYQPVIDLATGRVEGAEALARWFNGTDVVAPNDFIPIAEESGLIVPIGEAILLEACTKAAAWRGAGCALDIAVNVSARQVIRRDFFDVVQRCLARSGLAPRHLVLELTESVLLDVIGSASEGIQQLRALGVRFSIDDFGTGFSSLAYLHELTVDQLKIDRRFTNGLGKHPQDEAIVASIITLSQRLGLDLIAEGVETEQQAEHLRSLGCKRAQGFLFSRPVSDVELLRRAAPMPPSKRSRTTARGVDAPS